jgi:TonB family protein
LSARSVGWHAEHDLEERRRTRNAMSISIAIHASLFAALVISPPISYERMPQAISVELIAGPQTAAPAAPRAKGRPQSKPAPPPKAPEPPAEAAPEPPSEPAPPPPPKAPVAVLPENAPKPDQKVKQAPDKKKPQEVAKADTKPVKKPAEKPPKKDESLSYDDAMKSLDDELGEDETEDLLEAAPARPQRQTGTSGASESSSGVQLSPQDAAWMLATKRQIQMRWVTPSNFRNRGLATVLELELSASGEVLGEPRVVRASGDPYFDDNAVAAVLKSSPLPPPPRAGKTAFIFSSEEN